MNNDLYRKCLTFDFEKLFKEKGYAWFSKGAYNLNIIGVRHTATKCNDAYEDVLVLVYNTETKTKRMVYTITTTPSLYYLKNPIATKGTAILVPGQYRGCFKIGLHKGEYRALCQTKPVKVYRDYNKNDVYDLEPTTIEEGIYGINIHRSAKEYKRNTIGKYSAGCQVFTDPKEFIAFLRICGEQEKRYGNSFTYTLLDESDLKL